MPRLVAAAINKSRVSSAEDHFINIAAAAAAADFFLGDLSRLGKETLPLLVSLNLIITTTC
jgi:hypothetical protein